MGFLLPRFLRSHWSHLVILFEKGYTSASRESAYWTPPLPHSCATVLEIMPSTHFGLGRYAAQLPLCCDQKLCISLLLLLQYPLST